MAFIERAKQSLLSKAKRKRANPRSERNTRQSGYWGAFCEVHGTAPKPGAPKYVKVGFPLNKRQGLRGCPSCKSGS